ncbi:dihydropyrimidinase [Cupriavidus consociatus]|uniref:dihydropyrimidinase n=1 Tax=Cupriavidus consociatus TaxID=2821357 RepID=UPI001AE2ACA0|nr:dihydropyrimidinase [Cupriavidus sp. LEh21]MBP0621278.1 dihydropyrimidinase [Cupriavidus sp. LEh25]MDK2657950.1 dihydropyrimidinase [Cupriavidus sp. LEh21]
MKQFDLIIRNGTVVTASDTMQCDIAINGGRIVQLGLDLGDAAQVIDASGKLVLPGGVDAHCHLDQPMPDGLRMADDFRTGSVSAACGGTTTVIPFAAQEKGHSLRAAVDDYHRRAGGKSVVDYAFHLIVADPTHAVLQDELPGLIREGYSSFKIYMTYDDLKLDDREILEVLSVARQEGALVMVHAENSDCIAWLTDKLEAAGNTAPRFHALARPMAIEREATHRAITFSELVDVPILIVHVSGKEAVEQIRWARNRGMKIFAETCPQYLFLTAEDLDQPGYHGAKCVCSPPPRDRSNQEVIWDGLADGLFTIFSSDHAPFRYDDPEGKKPGGKEVPFQYIPNGIPGLETRLPLLFSAGVNGGRTSVNQFVALTSTNPAKLYGLHPRKGTIAIGADADLVLWDPQREVQIRNADLHHAVDYTPYEGLCVTGWPVTTLVRGKVVAHEGEVLAEAGHGEFLPCALPEMARPRYRTSGGSL